MIDVEILRNLYCVQMLSARKIAEIIGSNHHTILDQLQRHRIPRRPKHCFFTSEAGRRVSATNMLRAAKASSIQYHTDPQHAARVIESLDKARKANWKNPEYIEKMRTISSTTMAQTNSKRGRGLYPGWTARQKHGASERLRAAWKSGEQRKLLKRLPNGFRSKLEEKFAAVLNSRKIEWEYEPQGFPIIVNGKHCTYTPDFHLLASDRWIEIKGFFWDEDAMHRVRCFAEQYPHFLYTVLDAKFKTIIGPAWG